MKIAFLMDPIEAINFSTDSTWQLMLEAVTRGEVYYFTPIDLFWRNGELLARTQQVTISNNKYQLGSLKITNLEEMDVIFIRQVNSPKAIRDFPEKISILDYPSLIPPTLITSCPSEAKSFAKNYSRIILKPLYSFAGNDIFCTSYSDPNFTNIADSLLSTHKAPFIAQEFIPEVKFGDKRIIIVDGNPIGAFTRIPEENSIKSNIACGGTSHPTELNERDLQICQTISPKLKEHGLFFVGIDVIDKYLTEINVTSPTGIVPIQRFQKSKVTDYIFNAIENKRLTIPAK
jgi:glutathione synthase